MDYSKIIKELNEELHKKFGDGHERDGMLYYYVMSGEHNIIYFGKERIYDEFLDSDAIKDNNYPEARLKSLLKSRAYRIGRKYLRYSFDIEAQDVKNSINYFKKHSEYCDPNIDLDAILNNRERLENVINEVADHQSGCNDYEQLHLMWTLWALETESGLNQNEDEENGSMFMYEPLRIFREEE